MRRTIQGISTSTAAATAARRGTVETVMSCSEVRTCATLISRPTTTAAISNCDAQSHGQYVISYQELPANTEIENAGIIIPPPLLQAAAPSLKIAA